MARILITGCSTGIGRATALELTTRGHEVVATARRPETLEGLDVADALALDVTDDESVTAAVSAAGPLDGLVNNAGYEVAGPVERVPLDDVRAMFDTNLFGVVRLVQAVVPGMRERGHGTVVNVSSVAGRVSGPLNGFYAGSKHALEAMSDAMHYELGHFGLRVIVIEPGAIETSFGANVVHRGEDTPPYDELRRLWDGTGDVLRGGGPVPGPELVATAIADAIDDPASPRRIPVGDDAAMVIPVHRQLDDAEFEATMRATLQLDW